MSKKRTTTTPEEPMPFGSYTLGETLTDEEREANAEAITVARRRQAEEPNRVLFTRSAILNCMGAWSKGIMADAEVMALLDQHEANLRHAWENIERGRARKRAEAAIRDAIRAQMEGKLI